MALHDPEEDRRRGLLGIGDVISGARERAGEMGRGLLGGVARGAQALDQAMIRAGDEPRQTLRAFSPLGGVEGAAEAPGLFREGRPVAGTLAALGALPGFPRVRGLFRGLEGVKGLRVFARSEGPGIRRVVSITPNPKPGGGVKATIFEETADQGPVLQNVVEFKNMEEAVEAIEGGRGFFRGFKKVNVGDEAFMEGQFAQFTKESGGVSGFFNRP